MPLIKKIWHTFRFGLLLNELRQLLIKTGIEISPFFWHQEGLGNHDLSKFDVELNGYTFGFFGPSEMKEIAYTTKKHAEDMLASRLKEGKRCYGAKHHGQIASFVWFDLTECNYKGYKHPLADNEVYIFDGHTMRDFRGMNLAPILRFKSYTVLKEMGRNTFFSITQLTNTPAIKFKKKVDAKPILLGVYFSIFKMIRRTCILKQFKT